MRVAVVVEQAWDPASIEVDAAGAVDWSRAMPAPSPGSLEAVELALGLGEAHVFGLSGERSSVEPLLRNCLALGAATVAAAPDAYALAPALAGYDLVLAAHRSGDHGVSPVAGLLAGLLGLPQATAVESLSFAEGEATVIRRLDRGEREELAVPLPAVISVEPGIATPRAASPAALIAAREAPLATLPPTGRAPRAAFAGHQAPRPGPPRMRAPDGAHPAEARIAEVVGTEPEARQRELVTGTPAEIAERIVRLLESAGYLG